MLGLGDTNYDKFCNAAIKINRRLKELGARPFHLLGTADEVMGLETVVEPWCEGLWQALADVSENPQEYEMDDPDKVLTPEGIVGGKKKDNQEQPQEKNPSKDQQHLPKSDEQSSNEQTNTVANQTKEADKQTTPVKEQEAPGGIERTSSMGSVERRRRHQNEEADPRKTNREQEPQVNCGISMVQSLIAQRQRQQEATNKKKEQQREKKALQNRDGEGVEIPAGHVAPSVFISTNEDVVKPAPGVQPFEIVFGKDEVRKALNTLKQKKGKVRVPTQTLTVERKEKKQSELDSPIATYMVNSSSYGDGNESQSDDSIDGSIAREGRPAFGAPGTSLENAITVPVKKAEYLTAGGATAERRVVHMELDVSKWKQRAWIPGDAVGIQVPNPRREVENVCKRLGYHPMEPVTICSDSSAPTKSKIDLKGKTLPGQRVEKGQEEVSSESPTPETPSNSASTAVLNKFGALLEGVSGVNVIRDGPESVCEIIAPVSAVFTWCVDILSPPMKQALRLLSSYARSEEEKAVLAYLGSPAGNNAVENFIEKQRLTLLDVLALFPTCQPPVGHLLSVLSPLATRYYSMSNSPLEDDRKITFAFTVVAYECGVANENVESKVVRFGLATTYLEQIAQQFRLIEAPPQRKRVQEVDVRKEVNEDYPHLKIFLRPTRDFTLPGSLKWPLIMIGPGTGVAPFLGYLQHRSAKLKQALNSRSEVCSGTWRGGIDIEGLVDADADDMTSKALPKEVESELQRKHLAGNGGVESASEDLEANPMAAAGEVHLFFGNRSPHIDYLYRSSLKKFSDEQVLTRLYLAWSRHGSRKTYVQNRIRQPSTASEIANLILRRGAYIYVCGDGAQMAKDVHETLAKVLEVYGKVEDPEEYLQEMMNKQRYLRDLWS